MSKKADFKALSIMSERFGHDTLISLATTDGNRPAVRIVNSYYEKGSFYTVTYALSNKMKQIKKNPEVAVCGEWFTAHGVGEYIGHPHDKKNEELMIKLRAVFAEWYGNGHTDESDLNTCILRVRLTDGVLFSHGTKYEIDFTTIDAGNKYNVKPQNTSADTLPPLNEDDLNKAQELVLDAWNELNPKKSIALAKKALRVSPYCVDAYNILAYSNQDLNECKRLYTQGIQVGKRAFGKRFFKENGGYFWGMTEARPYMRAMTGLADCLWKLEERQNAIEIHEEMLRLNPNDNLGIRYMLINWLIAENAFVAAENILSNYPENSAFMLYSAALLYFKQGRKVKAKNALKKAMDSNSYVPEFLLNSKKKYVPETEAEKLFVGYQHGRPSEADEYRNLAGEIWQEVPGVLDWLKENVS